MRRVVSLLLAFLFLITVSCNSNNSPSPSIRYKPLTQKPIVKIALEDTVIITAHSVKSTSVGTGIVFTRDHKSYVWTCAHLFDDIAQSIVITDKRTGTTQPSYRFPSVSIVQKYMVEDRPIATLYAEANVLVCDFAQDLAVLEVKANVFSHSTAFYLDGQIPPVGEPIYNVGHYKGNFAEYSFTSGCVSFINRYVGKWDYVDQGSFVIYTGSSGGGVFLEDGRCIGIAVMTADGGDNCAFYVPIRRVRDWARKNRVEYLLDPSIPVGR